MFTFYFVRKKARYKITHILIPINFIIMKKMFSKKLILYTQKLTR